MPKGAGQKLKLYYLSRIMLVGWMRWKRLMHFSMTDMTAENG